MGPEAAIETGTTRESLRQWDSISHLNLILELEAEFDLHMVPDEIEDLSSVAKIVDLVSRRTERGS